MFTAELSPGCPAKIILANCRQLTTIVYFIIIFVLFLSIKKYVSRLNPL